MAGMRTVFKPSAPTAAAAELGLSTPQFAEELSVDTRCTPRARRRLLRAQNPPRRSTPAVSRVSHGAMPVALRNALVRERFGASSARACR